MGIKSHHWCGVAIVAALWFCGCRQSPEVPTARHHNDRLRTTWLGDAGLSAIYEVEIDGELYIVCDRGNGGTAIIQKIRPTTD